MGNIVAGNGTSTVVGRIVINNSGTSTIGMPLTGSGSLEVSLWEKGVGGEGQGTLILNAANTYTGSTTIVSGVLMTGVANAVNPSSNVTVNTGAILDLDGCTETFNHLSGYGNINLDNGTLTVGSDNGNTTFNGFISGAGNLSKVGTGTLTLTGNSTFSGTMTISGGTVILSGGGMLQPDSNTTIKVIVNGGGTLILNDTGGNASASRLGGNGTVNIVLAGGELKLLGSSSSPITENFGTLTLGSGSSTVTVIPYVNNPHFTTLSGSGLDRKSGATVLFRGTGLGTSGAGAVANIMFSTNPVTGNISSTPNIGNTTCAILPYALGDTSATGSGFEAAGPTAGGFVTYDTNGIRLLKTTEFVMPLREPISRPHNTRTKTSIYPEAPT